MKFTKQITMFALAISLLLILFSISFADEPLDFIEYFNATNNSGVEGITQNGTYFWILDNDSAKIRSYHMNYSYSSYFNCSGKTMFGLTTDNNWIWASDTSAKEIVKYTMGGVLNQTYDINDTINEYGSGMTTDGNYIYILNSNEHFIYQYYMNMTYTNTSISIGALVQQNSLAIEEDYLWVGNDEPSRICRYYLNGTFKDCFKMDEFSTASIGGITANHSRMWVTKDSSPYKIYVYNLSSLYLTSNTIPVLVDKDTYPDSPKSSNDLKFNITCSDIDIGDNLTGYLQLYNNSVVFGVVKSSNITNGTSHLIYTLGSGNTTYNENWTGQYWCGDGVLNTSKENDTVTISPELPPLNLTPNNPLSNSNTSSNYVLLNMTYTGGSNGNITYYEYPTNTSIYSQNDTTSGSHVTFNWTGLTNKTYYWYGYANNGSNLTTEVYNFTTISCLNQLDSFSVRITPSILYTYTDFQLYGNASFNNPCDYYYEWHMKHQNGIDMYSGNTSYLNNSEEVMFINVTSNMTDFAQFFYVVVTVCDSFGCSDPSPIYNNDYMIAPFVKNSVNGEWVNTSEHIINLTTHLGLFSSMIFSLYKDSLQWSLSEYMFENGTETNMASSTREMNDSLFISATTSDVMGHSLIISKFPYDFYEGEVITLNVSVTGGAGSYMYGYLTQNKSTTSNFDNDPIPLFALASGLYAISNHLFLSNYSNYYLVFDAFRIGDNFSINVTVHSLSMNATHTSLDISQPVEVYDSLFYDNTTYTHSPSSGYINESRVKWCVATYNEGDSEYYWTNCNSTNLDDLYYFYYDPVNPIYNYSAFLRGNDTLSVNLSINETENITFTISNLSDYSNFTNVTWWLDDVYQTFGNVWNWITGYEDSGERSVVAKIIDGVGNYVEQSWRTYVTNVNRKPNVTQVWELESIVTLDGQQTVYCTGVDPDNETTLENMDVEIAVSPNGSDIWYSFSEYYDSGNSRWYSNITFEWVDKYSYLGTWHSRCKLSDGFLWSDYAYNNSFILTPNYTANFNLFPSNNSKIDLSTSIGCMKYDNVTSSYKISVWISYNTSSNRRITRKLINNATPFVYHFDSWKLPVQENIEITCQIGDVNKTHIVEKVRDFKSDILIMDDFPLFAIDRPINLGVICDLVGGKDSRDNSYRIASSYADCNGDGKWDYEFEHEHKTFTLDTFVCIYKFLDTFDLEAGCVIERVNDSLAWNLEPCKSIRMNETYCVLSAHDTINVFT